jgi:phage gp29-like protein
MVEILDRNGRPYRTPSELLKREVSGPSIYSNRNNISFHPSEGLTPEYLASILRQSEYGDPIRYLQLAADMEEKDLHYRAELTTRKLAVSGIQLQVKPAGKLARDLKIAAFVSEQLAPIQRGINNYLDAIGKGFSVSEIIWDQSSPLRWTIERIEWREPEWFVFDPYDQSKILLKSYGADGLPSTFTRGGAFGSPLIPHKFITHLPPLKSGIPIRVGLARIVAWGYLFKNFQIKDWLVFAEKYGQPFRVGQFGQNTTDKQVAQFLDDLIRMGSDAAIALPKEYSIQLIESASKGASAEVFQNFIDYVDSKVSLVVLGQSLSTSQGKSSGSFAQAKVHNEVRRDIQTADAQHLIDTLNRDVIRSIVDLNFPEDKRGSGYPTFELPIEDKRDLNELSAYLGVVVPLGVRVSESWVRAQAGIPDPEQGEAVLQMSAPLASPRQV